MNDLALAQRETPGALVDVEGQRAISETQGAMIIAKKFPRDQKAAIDRIKNTCSRKSLAEVALYQYSRGGTDITGPSIRLAEAIAQQWGNLQFGIRELDQRSDHSSVESFAWDIETNTRQTKTFQVPHTRYSRKKGNYKLTDPRDIYELIANQGARRLRACILGIVPGDVVETAVKQCEETLKTNVEITPERIKSLVEKFKKFGVTKKQIEDRIQRRLDTITPALMVNLGKIYNSLSDGMSVPADWFGVPGVNNKEAPPAPDKGKVDEFNVMLDDRIKADYYDDDWSKMDDDEAEVIYGATDAFLAECAEASKISPDAVKVEALNDFDGFYEAVKPRIIEALNALDKGPDDDPDGQGEDPDPGGNNEPVKDAKKPRKYRPAELGPEQNWRRFRKADKMRAWVMDPRQLAGIPAWKHEKKVELQKKWLDLGLPVQELYDLFPPKKTKGIESMSGKNGLEKPDYKGMVPNNGSDDEPPVVDENGDPISDPTEEEDGDVPETIKCSMQNGALKTYEECNMPVDQGGCPFYARGGHCAAYNAQWGG